MKYYSDITNQLYETREQLFKAERDYKTELIAKARADEKAKKIADLEAQIAELKGESVKADKPLASEKSKEDNTAPTKVYDAGREDKIDYSKTIEAIKNMIDDFKFKYPTFEFQDVEEDELTTDDVKEDNKSSTIRMNIKAAPRPGAKATCLATEKTAPAKTNGSCGKCGKCVKIDTDGDKRGKLADSGYYSSSYVNLNGKEFYSEGADSWNDVKKAIREYFEKLQGLN